MKTKERRLYHYTKSLDTLCCYVLKDGFWPQYSLEDFSWVQNGKPLYLAFPCVCFTGLPLEQSQMHRDDYGNYVIGFHGSWDAAQRLKPLKYEDKATSLLNQHHCRALTKCDDVDVTGHFHPTKLKPEDFDGVWEILPYLKENVGFTFQRRLKPLEDRRHNPHCKDLENEREWRYIPEKHRGNLFTVEDYDVTTMDALDKLSEVTRDSYLKFDHSDVSVIVVITDAERQQLAAKHPKLDGKIRIWDELPKPRAE